MNESSFIVIAEQTKVHIAIPGIASQTGTAGFATLPPMKSRGQVFQASAQTMNMSYTVGVVTKFFVALRQ